jgi:hypothetical protein
MEQKHFFSFRRPSKLGHTIAGFPQENMADMNVTQPHGDGAAT